MSSTLSRIALIILLAGCVSIAAGKTPVSYETGTVAKNTEGSCDIMQATGEGYRVSCGDLQNGQSVDYRASGDRIYIRRDDGKEDKYATKGKISVTPTPAEKRALTYLKGTILGYETRRDLHVGGGGGGGNGMPTNPVSAWVRHAKVYELRGADFIYKVDFCGAFQAGKFEPGQTVDYRVERDRLYILHDGDQEYSCQIEGKRAPEDQKSAETAKPDLASPSKQ